LQTNSTPRWGVFCETHLVKYTGVQRSGTIAAGSGKEIRADEAHAQKLNSNDLDCTKTPGNHAKGTPTEVAERSTHEKTASMMLSFL